MNETVTLALAWGAGSLLGLIFFGGLWWTVHKGVSAQSPAIWFLGSMLLRMGIAVAGFYFVAAGHWRRLLFCLLGFLTARLAVTWLTRPFKEKLTPPRKEAAHAPQS